MNLAASVAMRPHAIGSIATTTLVRPLVLALAAAALTACGQKGPLTLPQSPAQAAAASAPAR